MNNEAESIAAPLFLLMKDFVDQRGFKITIGKRPSLLILKRVGIMASMSEIIERLTALEYAIRQSMAVREDQDEPAELQHAGEARRHGILIEDGITKGELLNAVQTSVRAKMKQI